MKGRLSKWDQLRRNVFHENSLGEQIALFCQPHGNTSMHQTSLSTVLEAMKDDDKRQYDNGFSV
jgi:hypothetical protein